MRPARPTAPWYVERVSQLPLPRLAVLEQLTEHAPTVCSGYAPNEMTARFLSAPKVGHLQKPYTRAVLAGALEALARARGG